jgi:hypothetical protein
MAKGFLKELLFLFWSFLKKNKPLRAISNRKEALYIKNLGIKAFYFLRPKF